jgi:hypothetical protein
LFNPSLKVIDAALALSMAATALVASPMIRMANTADFMSHLTSPRSASNVFGFLGLLPQEAYTGAPVGLLRL